MRNSIIVRDPFREFDGLVRRAFGPSAFDSFPGSNTEAERGFVPSVESFRDGEDAVVRVDLPGIDVSKDVEVEVREGRLVVSGSRRDERAEESEGRHLREVRYGSFRRTFRLGRTVTADAVSASYDAGVLTIRVAGAYAVPAGQRIEIATGEIPVTQTVDGTAEGSDEGSERESQES